MAGSRVAQEYEKPRLHDPAYTLSRIEDLGAVARAGACRFVKCREAELARKKDWAAVGDNPPMKYTHAGSKYIVMQNKFVPWF